MHGPTLQWMDGSAVTKTKTNPHNTTTVNCCNDNDDAIGVRAALIDTEA